MQIIYYTIQNKLSFFWRKIDNWRMRRSGIEYIEDSNKYSDYYYAGYNQGGKEGCLITKLNNDIYQVNYYEEKYIDVPEETKGATKWGKGHGYYIKPSAKYFLGVLIRNTKIKLYPSGIKKVVYN